MVTKKNQKHTLLGVELVRKLSEEGKQIFTLQDAREVAPSCGIADSYLVESLHHLTNTNWIIHLKRGLYAICSSFPGATPLHEFEIAMALAQPSAISHWSAMHFHGMTEQIPQRVYITTTQPIVIPKSASPKNLKSSCRKVNGILYEFIKLIPERFFGTKEYWIGEAKVRITDPERTLIDGLVNPRYFGDWPQIYTAFESQIFSLDLDKLVAYSIRFNAAVAKRLGWILEKLEVEKTILQKLENVLVKGYRVLDPSGPRKGPCSKKWMIQENLPGRLMI